MADKPRQYFPGEYDPEFDPGQAPGQVPGQVAGHVPGRGAQTHAGYESAQTQYQAAQPAAPVAGAPSAGVQWEDEPRPARGSNGLAGVLGFVAAVALIAAGALFFLWRSAAAEADREPPAPVTETQVQVETETVTETATVTETVTETIDAPTLDVPTDIQDGADNVRDFVDGLLRQNGGAPAEPQPVQ